MGQFTLTYVDYDDETSLAKFPASDITAANADAEYAASLALQNAVEDIVLGLLTRTQFTARTSPIAVGKSSNELAHREAKALVRYYDDTTFERGKMELPCPDMSLQHPTMPGYYYKAGVSGHEAVWETFVTAFEAFVPGPGGNAAVIEEVVHVGRNL